MKNKILKIWGLVMVVAILAGLLVPAAVPVSADNLAYSNVALPNGNNNQFIQGVSISQLVIAPDGKTAFAYSNAVVASATANAGQNGAIGTATLNVNSTNGYANNGSLILGSQGAYITYTAKTATSFTGIPTVGNPGAITADPSGTLITQKGQLFKSLDGGVTWTNQGYGNGLNGSPVVALAISPQYATDTTLLAASNAPVNPNIAANTLTLYRSTDAGANFGVVPQPAGGTFAAWIGNAGIQISSIAISQYYLGGQAILVGYTTNGTDGGGAALFVANTFTWTDLTNVTGWSALNSTANLDRMDVLAVGFSPKYTTDSEIFVVAANNTTTFLRTRLGTDAWDLDIGAVALSNDQGTNTPSENGLIANLALPSDYDWTANNRVFVGLGDSANPLPAVVAGFDVYRVNGQAGATTEAGGAITATLSRAFDLNVTGTGLNYTNVSDIAFSGVLATGTLAVGLVAPAGTAPDTIYTATGAGASPSFVASNYVTSPLSAGGLTQLAFSPIAATGKPNTLYVGTQSTAGATIRGGALYTSTDYMNYAATSLISVSAVANLVPGLPGGAGTDMFTIYRDQVGGAMAAGDLSMLLKSTDGGNTWIDVLNHVTTGAEYLAATAVSPTFSTDNIIYVRQTDSRIWKSTDAGNTWSGYNSPNSVGIASMTLIDANTYYIGATAASGGGLYKSGVFTQVAALDGNQPFLVFLGTFPSIGDPNVIFITTTTGEIYYSSDAGLTFTALGGQGAINGHGAFNFVSIAFDSNYKTNKTIYASSGKGNFIYRWVVGTSTAWETMATLGTTQWMAPNQLVPPVNQIAPAISAMSVAGNDIMYVAVSDSTNAPPVIYRNLDPTETAANQVFTAIANTTVTGFPIGQTGLGGANTYATLSPPFLVLPSFSGTPPKLVGNTFTFLTKDGTPGTSTNGYPYQWLKMTDTMVAGPATISPKANGQVPTGVTFSWAPVAGATGYNVALATDAQFQGTVGAQTGLNSPNNPTGATSVTLPSGTLNPGTTYYWKVQVITPLTSPFSAPITFSVLLAQSGNMLNVPGQYGPVAGATGVPVKPVFQWAAVQGAQSYNLQVADNPVFVNPLDSQTGLNTTVWTETKTLSPNTVYYWRVQAVAANGTASDWVAGSFTTAGPVSTSTAPATSVPPITITQTQAPVTITATPAPKFFDPNSGLYFNSQSELSAYQAAHPAGTSSSTPSTPSYIWVIIVIGAILVIAVIVLIVRTRKV